MALSVQSHQPLITARIIFRYNELPPPPQITAREKYPPNLRRRARQMLAPYQKRPVLFRTERSMSPGRNMSTVRFESSAPVEHSVNLHLRSESPLSDLSDMSDDSGASDSDERGAYSFQNHQAKQEGPTVGDITFRKNWDGMRSASKSLP